MARSADNMETKGISREDTGAVVVDFTRLLPGKAGEAWELPLSGMQNGPCVPESSWRWKYPGSGMALLSGRTVLANGMRILGLTPLGR